MDGSGSAPLLRDSITGEEVQTQRVPLLLPPVQDYPSFRAAAAGATAVIQPGGSLRDDEVIRAADEANLAMVFTGMRHFRH